MKQFKYKNQITKFDIIMNTVMALIAIAFGLMLTMAIHSYQQVGG